MGYFVAVALVIFAILFFFKSLSVLNVAFLKTFWQGILFVILLFCNMASYFPAIKQLIEQCLGPLKRCCGPCFNCYANNGTEPSRFLRALCSVFTTILIMWAIFITHSQLSGINYLQYL